MPTATHSICSRSSFASRKAAPIISSHRVAPGPLATTSCAVPSSEFIAATLRRGEENSSARIFIDDAALLFVLSLQRDPAHRLRFGQQLATSSHVVAEPSLRPFNNRDAIRPQIFLQTRRQNLFPRFETVQIQMKQSKPSAGVHIDERKRRRMHPRGNTQTSRDAPHETSFARAKITRQRDDPPALCLAAPRFTED